MLFRHNWAGQIGANPAAPTSGTHKLTSLVRYKLEYIVDYRGRYGMAKYADAFLLPDELKQGTYYRTPRQSTYNVAGGNSDGRHANFYSR